MRTVTLQTVERFETQTELLLLVSAGCLTATVDLRNRRDAMLAQQVLTSRAVAAVLGFETDEQLSVRSAAEMSRHQLKVCLSKFPARHGLEIQSARHKLLICSTQFSSRLAK
jgi:hypothetical protein